LLNRNIQTFLLSLLALTGVSLVSGCSNPAPGQQAGGKEIAAVYDDRGRLAELRHDTTGDGQIDTRVFMEGPRAVRSEIDENGDGTVDRWEYYEPAPPGATGALVVLQRVERATRHDGKVSRWEYYENGIFKRVEEDTTADGKVDKWEIYEDGALLSVALDTEGLGRPTRRLLYRSDGSLDLIEVDPDGTGVFRPLR
jgi:hypothetical protein